MDMGGPQRIANFSFLRVELLFACLAWSCVFGVGCIIIKVLRIFYTARNNNRYGDLL